MRLPNPAARGMLLLALVAAGAVSAQAAAEPVEVTRQALGVRAEFLLRSAPPAPAAPICLIATGVTVNPDTAGVIERPNSNESWDTDVEDRSSTGHGTRMAMVISGQANGFGMVGLWPSARIVSMRAHKTELELSPAVGHVFGMSRCETSSTASGRRSW